MTDSKIKIIFSPQFVRDAKQLRKKYRKVDNDIRALVERLKAGETPGDRLQGVDAVVYKVRIRNSDVERGKSAGYRVAYLLKTDKLIFLLTIYSKFEQSDVPVNVVQQVVADVLAEYTSSPDSTDEQE
jgi:mRNA-degrading endonuclease RelE of RelBE toxin-antitoxin system